VNVVEGLQTIRRRLEENGADAESLSFVDQITKRAALPAAKSANAQSLLQLVRMLMRSPAAASNVRVNASHCGMAVHGETYRVVARALAGFTSRAQTAAPAARMARAA